MLVMIRWFMTITNETMLARWSNVADKFNLDLGLKGRLAKHCGRFAKRVGCHRWTYLWKAELTGRTLVRLNVASRVLPFA